MWWNKIRVIAALSLTLGAASAQEPNGPPAPIFIESDSLVIDDQQGVSTYQGNVIFRQGGDQLLAEEVRIYAEQRQDVERVIAEGSPARFDHKAVPPEEEDLWGEAERIEHYAEQDLFIFIGNAKFQQGENRFEGPRIEYQAENRLVKAGGDGRVQITIQPKATNGQNGTTEAQ